MNFEPWYKELCSDEIWVQPASMQHKPETFENLARKVYMSCVADNYFKPMNECRKHVYNIVCQTPADKVKVDWVAKALQKQEDEKKEEWKPVSWEKRAEYLEQLQTIIKGSVMMNGMPRISEKEKIENGGWLPAKGAPYPVTSARELYIRQRHFAYIERCFDARTAQALPTWIPEEEFNSQYDEKESVKLEKKVYKVLNRS